MYEQGRQSQSIQKGEYIFDLKVKVNMQSGHVKLSVPPPQQPMPRPFEYLPSIQSPPLMNQIQPFQSNFCPPQILLQNRSFQAPFHYLEQRRVEQKVNKQSTSTLEELNKSLESQMYAVEKSIELVECVICRKTFSSSQFNEHLNLHINRSTINFSRENSFSTPPIQIKSNHEYSFQDPLKSRHPSAHSPNQADNSFSSNQHHYSKQVHNLSQNHQKMSENNFLVSLRSSQSSISQKQSNSNFIVHEAHPQQKLDSSFFQNSSSHEREDHLHYLPPNNFVAQSQFRRHTNRTSPVFDIKNDDFSPFPENVKKVQSRIQTRPLEIGEENVRKVDQKIFENNTSFLSSSFASERSYNHSAQGDYFSKTIEQTKPENEEFKLNYQKGYAYKSVQLNQSRGSMSNSRNSERSSKKKLPVNYLAREEFITNSTHQSGVEGSRGMKK